MAYPTSGCKCHGGDGSAPDAFGRTDARPPACLCQTARSSRETAVLLPPLRRPPGRHLVVRV